MSTPLHLAALENSIECLKSLVHHRAEINVANEVRNYHHAVFLPLHKLFFRTHKYYT